MAQGFKDIQVPSFDEDAGYETIFEKLKQEAGGENQSFLWYRNKIRNYALGLSAKPEAVIKSELRDRIGEEEFEDENQIRKYAVSGHMYIFEYKAKMASKLAYYDEFPLVYVIKASRTEFWGLNLHYMSPKKRAWVVKRLLDGKIDAPRSCFHKYLSKYVEGYYLDLAASEWATAILLPIETFVRQNRGKGGNNPIQWKLYGMKQTRTSTTRSNKEESFVVMENKKIAQW